MISCIRDPRESFTKRTMYAETCQAHRTGDRRRTAVGILSDREWKYATALHAANQISNQGAGATLPSHKLADRRKDGARCSCGENFCRRRDQTRDNLSGSFTSEQLRWQRGNW